MPKRSSKLLVLHGVVLNGSQQKPISIMIDTGCSVTCIPEDTARSLGLKFRRKPAGVKYFAVLADGSQRQIDFEVLLTMRLGPKYTTTVKADISHGTLEPNDMLLGMDWMTVANPKFNFSTLSVRVTDRDGRSCELIGMRPPGAPRYCSEHGYRCKGRSRESYGIPGAMRSGGYGHGQRSPFIGFGKGIPIFRYEVVEENGLPCILGKSENREEESIDWRDLFPDRDWYTESKPEQQTSITTTEKLKLFQDEAEEQERTSSKAKGSPKPRMMPNTIGTMSLAKQQKKKRPENFDFFR